MKVGRKMLTPLLKFASGFIIPRWLKWVAVGLVAGALVATGWTINGWRKDLTIADMKTANAQAKADAQETARKQENEWNTKLQEAQNVAKKREADLRRYAAGADRAADELRDELSAIQRDLPNLAADACRQRADALATVFGACIGEYTEMAQVADRHASDKQTLMESWPVNQPLLFQAR